ncbi:hypothetical protein [Tepidibacillus marianensis]|uniref:hypothetical protein n=1 Tax=Tepidibacillus marianensis TaxID=3131995 RepID=UPI0030D55105
MDYIRQLLRARAAALLPVTIVREDNNITFTNVQIAFINDNAVAVAVGNQIRVIPINRILEVR